MILHKPTYMLFFFLVCSLLLHSQQSMAQQKDIEEPKDTSHLISGVEVTYNVAGTVMRMVSSYGEYEAAVRVSLRNKFFPALEVGYGSSDHETDIVTGLHVKSNAPFFRIGCDYNIAKSKKEFYNITAGLRYGFTRFDFHADANLTDPTYGNLCAYNIDESGLTYHWAEIVFGIGAKLWGPVYLGWTIRYKMKISGSEGSHGQLWYIPGFGEEGNKIGATFNVGVRI